ncbi:hypothetical protein ABZ921_07320 [Streptomyces atriruber]|uniref:Uncharacterized protein n=1 Tax=Streptomyces atriruber TaxID=545121 RepID=A0ABV3BHH8_9ACTN
MVGKQYLLELTAAGLPVTPTVDDSHDVGRLPQTPTYVVRPKAAGADPIGLEFVREGLAGLPPVRTAS